MDPAGQALPEFALVVPVIILILFGAIDFGRVIADFNALQNVAREGARYSIIHAGQTDSSGNPLVSDCSLGDGATNCSNIINDGLSIAPLLTRSSITSFSMAYTQYPLNDPSGTQAATVTVQYSFKPVTTFVLRGAAITLSAHAVYLQQ
jgi:Flp pilus assembly protein TadG